MSQIRIRLRPPTAYGRLYPRYDTEANLLEVGSAISRDWLYGVDIDGALIFDIDANHILANFDLLIRPELWEVTPLPNRPKPLQEADIEFLDETIRHKSFTMPLRVQTDRNRSYAHIMFGPSKDGIWITLSEYCMALLADDCLAGFFVILRDKY